MIHPEKLEGNFINLRSVLETDAEFILKLRLNNTLNKYLNKSWQWFRKAKIMD